MFLQYVVYAVVTAKLIMEILRDRYLYSASETYTYTYRWIQNDVIYNKCNTHIM